MKVFQDLDVVELISNPLKVSPDSEYSQALLSCNAKELLCKFPALKEKFWDEKDGPKFKLFEKWWKAHKRTHKRREKREASAASTSRQVRFNMDPNMPNKNRNAARGSNNSRTPGKTHNEPSTPAPTAFGNCGNNRNTRPHNRAPSSARHGTHAPAPTTPAPTRRNRGAPRSTAAAPSTPKELSPHYAAELAVFGNLLKTAEKTGKEWREKNDRTEANESALLQSVSSQFTEWSTSARK